MARVLPSLLLGLAGLAAAIPQSKSACPSNSCMSEIIIYKVGVLQCNVDLEVTETASIPASTVEVTAPIATHYIPTTVTETFTTGSVVNTTVYTTSTATYLTTNIEVTEATKTVYSDSTVVDYLSTTLATVVTNPQKGTAVHGLDASGTADNSPSSAATTLAIPGYAPDCASWEEYTSQCLCAGATAGTTTVTPLPTTITVTITPSVNASCTETVDWTSTAPPSTSTLTKPQTVGFLSFASTSTGTYYVSTTTQARNVTITKSETLASVTTTYA